MRAIAGNPAAVDLRPRSESRWGPWADAESFNAIYLGVSITAIDIHVRPRSP